MLSMYQKNYIYQPSWRSGILHFAGALLDRKLPLTFSNGLPNDVVATWDGRWIARDCCLTPQGMTEICTEFARWFNQLAGSLSPEATEWL